MKGYATHFTECLVPFSAHIYLVINKWSQHYRKFFHMKKTRFISNVLHSAFVQYFSGRRENKGTSSVKINVHVSPGSRGAANSWSQGICEFFLSGLRAWHVELISYRWADYVDKMIVVTVRCHSHRALTYSQCLFLWYLGVRQQQFMVRWQLDSTEGSVKRQSMEIAFTLAVGRGPAKEQISQTRDIFCLFWLKAISSLLLSSLLDLAVISEIKRFHHHQSYGLQSLCKRDIKYDSKI